MRSNNALLESAACMIIAFMWMVMMKVITFITFYFLSGNQALLIDFICTTIFLSRCIKALIGLIRGEQ